MTALTIAAIIVAAQAALWLFLIASDVRDSIARFENWKRATDWTVLAFLSVLVAANVVALVLIVRSAQ